MKVALASTSSRYSNGASKCLIELSEKLILEGVGVLVLLPRRGELEDVLKKKGIKYIIARETHYSWIEYSNESNTVIKRIFSKFINYLSILKVSRILKKEQINIVHVNAVTAYVAGASAVKCNIPLVWHIREFLDEDLHGHFVNQKYSVQLISKSKSIIAISNTVKEKWKKILGDSIEVIYDGLPVEKYYINKKRQHNGINVLLYGRVSPGKGQLFYVQAINNLKDKLPKGIHFSFAGFVEDKIYFEKITKYITEHSLEKLCQYDQEISDIKNKLSMTDIVCVCSDQEGFGRVTVEAMLGKCIVLGANTGATTELIIDGENGFLYEKGNVQSFSEKLLYIIENITTIQNNIDNISVLAKQKFTIEKDVKKVIEIYNRVGR